MYNMYISVIAIKLNSKKMQMGKNDSFSQNCIQVGNCRHIHINQFFILLEDYRGEERVNNKSSKPEKIPYLGRFDKLKQLLNSPLKKKKSP